MGIPSVGYFLLNLILTVSSAVYFMGQVSSVETIVTMSPSFGLLIVSSIAAQGLMFDISRDGLSLVVVLFAIGFGYPVLFGIGCFTANGAVALDPESVDIKP